MYEAKTDLELPVLDKKGHRLAESTRVKAGQRVSNADLQKAGQTDEDIAALVKGGALEEAS